MLGPEMKSTGEVLGIAPTFHEAMMKGLVAAGYQFKVPGPGSCVIISVKDSDKLKLPSWPGSCTTTAIRFTAHPAQPST